MTVVVYCTARTHCDYDCCVLVTVISSASIVSPTTPSNIVLLTHCSTVHVFRTNRAAVGDDSIQRLAQKQEMANQLRRQLRGRDETLTTLQRQLDEATAARVRLEGELQTATARAEAASQQARRYADGSSSSSAAVTAAAAAEVAKLRREADTAAATVRQLRAAAASHANDDSNGSSDVVRLKAELARLQSERGLRNSSASGAGAASLIVVQQLEERIDALQQDNDRLNRELQAFDLDFFEEIEDLKFKYSEAVRRLRTYEG
jgi:chromosome segregation ATPase